MAKEYSRTQRVAQEIQKEIAIILQHEITDSRLGMVTVSGVKMSRDLAYAKVFVTFLNDHTPEQVEIGIQLLQDTVGCIRNMLGKAMRLRVVPRLTFSYAYALVEGVRMSSLLTNIVKSNYLRQGIHLIDDTEKEEQEE